LSNNFPGAFENDSFHVPVKFSFHKLLKEGGVYELFGGCVQRNDPKTYAEHSSEKNHSSDPSSEKNDFEIVADGLTSFEE
jgi:hypothetical protein